MSSTAVPTTAAGSPPSSPSDKPPAPPKRSTTTTTTTPKPKPLQAWLDAHLPAWLALALRTRRTWKTFIRCIVVFVVMMTLLVDQVTLQTLGQAAFFGAIVSLMLTPNMAVSLFMIAAIMLVVGMCLGWAWGCAAMAASLAARSQTLLASQYTTAESNLISGVAPDAQFQAFVFQGLFLDPAASTVFGVFFFVGTFGFALIRAYAPRLTLLAIFGTIVLDVMCSYGPLFPSAQYMLATLFLIPTAMYIAVALAGILLIFPESMNHVWMTTLTETVLTPAHAMLASQQPLLALDPSDTDAWQETRDSVGATARNMIEATQGLMGQTGMVDLEVSRGRLGPGDLKAVGGKMMGLASRTLGLMSFMILVDDRNKGDAASPAGSRPNGASSGVDKPAKDKDKDPLSPLAPGTGTATPQSAQRFDMLREKVRRREAEHGHDLDNLLPLLLDGTRGLLAACEGALKGRIEWLRYVNSTRWRGSKSQKEEESAYEEAKAQVEAVRTALASLRGEQRLRVLEPFEKFFDPASGNLLEEIRQRADERIFAANSLFLCFVFGTTLKAYAETLLELLDVLVELQRKRARNRLWFPSGFGKIGRKLLARHADEGTGLEMGVSAAVAAGEDDATAVDSSSVSVEDDEGEIVHESKAQPLDPDSSPPRTWLGRGYMSLTAGFRWFMRPQAIFALRYSVVSISIFAFAVHPRTAYFNYANRGLWALIMAQTGLGVYAGEQIASFILRVSGTMIGLVLGMLAWYIGAGRGNGNGYGMVVITTVIISPFLFIRVAGPMQSIVVFLMIGTMIIFVVGYSWVDSHVATISNAGVGVFIAWRRALLVLIGFGCAFVVMVLPYPTSARQVVRKTLAFTTEELGNVLALEMDGCIQSTHDTETHWKRMKDQGLKSVGGRVLGISQQLQGILPSMTTAKFEPTFKGPWPADTYQRLMLGQWRFIQSIALLNASLSDLNAAWLHTLVHKTPFFNPNFLADLSSTIYIVARCLRHGNPIPATLVPLRERLIYHDRHGMAFGSPRSTEPEILPDELQAGPEHIDGARIGLREMTLSTLKDEQLVFHSTAIVALAQVIRTVDNITEIVRELCGTTQMFVGLDTMRDEYLGMEEAAIRRMEKRK
ncbi:hypothetical protein CALCODRAFT_450301 [Calocera cornea HHB12733]|uniref:ER transporter 6TM N-terminal domain-containing protein n=1 Tax=Calocera cornea HHB12733 TaxID=1353952 RepID=A0A165HFH9_9BASI|nr:hypothetical protein CALCODRAFT_450301 [Calocera cornea HHB12733]